MNKRIALIAPNLRSGGSERMLSRLSLALKDKYEVDVILFDSSIINYDYSGRLIDLKSGTSTWKIKNLVCKIRRVVKANIVLYRNQYNTIFLFSESPNKLLKMCPTATKVFYSCRGYAYLNSHYAYYHHLLSRNRNILFNSQAMRNAYLDRYPNDQKKTVVAYNFFDDGIIGQKAILPLSSEENAFFKSHQVIVSVGRFTQEKGQWNLVKAFHLLKKTNTNIGLVFVGYGGENEARIKQMVHDSGFERDVLFTGFSDNPYKYMSRATVFVLPSVTEGFPNVLVEAMMCGVPVIATDCMTGPSEILRKDWNSQNKIDDFEVTDYGVLISPMPETPDFVLESKTREHSVLSNAIDLLLSDEALREKLISASKNRCEQFTEESLLSQYINLIERSAQ